MGRGGGALAVDGCHRPGRAGDVESRQPGGGGDRKLQKSSKLLVEQSPYRPLEAPLPFTSLPDSQPKASLPSTNPIVARPKALWTPTSPMSSFESRVGPRSITAEPPLKICRLSQGARPSSSRKRNVYAGKFAHTIGLCSWGTHEESED
ncbi:hypothetical protein E3N88_04513 [Mikania micrantha]|uniref:Uncharacterized protein n=1 Tax=Mikania micrantha TaxID=192012 RepID=A0A5N6PUN9_9ASTR|nr:hypothetical protein E3N88_04513 [Mikania micrantha]